MGIEADKYNKQYYFKVEIDGLEAGDFMQADRCDALFCCEVRIDLNGCSIARTRDTEF